MEIFRSPATLEHLREIQAFVLKRATSLGVPPDTLDKLELVMEELVVNVINYAYDDEGGEFEVECSVVKFSGGRALSIMLRDWGVAFDPLARDMPDTSLGLEDRPVGGLGIFLVSQMSDQIDYVRKDNANVLTIFFALSGATEKSS